MVYQETCPEDGSARKCYDRNCERLFLQIEHVEPREAVLGLAGNLAGSRMSQREAVACRSESNCELRRLVGPRFRAPKSDLISRPSLS